MAEGKLSAFFMNLTQKFKNKPAILIATGPSLTKEVVELIEEYKNDYIIIGCNDSYKLVDFLDIHYACDKTWWDVHGDDFREKFPELESWTQDEGSAKKYNLHLVKGEYKPGLSLVPNKIHWGSNSGFQILNLALLWGCSKFILVGYNMSRVNGVAHFFGEHPKPLQKDSPYSKFVREYSTINDNIKKYIVNCTPNSALRMFKYKDLEEELIANHSLLHKKHPL